MTAIVTIRPFEPRDAEAVSRVARRAFGQFSDAYDDWPRMEASIAKMPDLASSGRIFVGEVNGAINGAVAYIPANVPKAEYFDSGWPVIRMLVVDPAARGQGIGRALTLACIDAAKADGCAEIALHTSPIMAVALPMYQRMGFEFVRAAPDILGVAYAVYRLQLDPHHPQPTSSSPA